MAVVYLPTVKETTERHDIETRQASIGNSLAPQDPYLVLEYANPTYCNHLVGIQVPSVAHAIYTRPFQTIYPATSEALIPHSYGIRVHVLQSLNNSKQHMEHEGLGSFSSLEDQCFKRRQRETRVQHVGRQHREGYAKGVWERKK